VLRALIRRGRIRSAWVNGGPIILGGDVRGRATSSAGTAMVLRADSKHVIIIAGNGENPVPPGFSRDPELLPAGNVPTRIPAGLSRTLETQSKADDT